MPSLPGLLCEPGCEQGWVQHRAPAAGNTGTQALQELITRVGCTDGRANMSSSLNDAHFVGDCWIWWFHHSPSPWPFSFTFPCSLPALYLWNLFSQETELLSKQALPPPTISLKWLFLFSPSPLSSTVWDSFSKVFPALSSGSQGCCFLLLFHYQMFYHQPCFPSPTLPWGSNVSHSTAAKYSKIVQSCENPDVNPWQHTGTWRLMPSFVLQPLGTMGRMIGVMIISCPELQMVWSHYLM